MNPTLPPLPMMGRPLPNVITAGQPSPADFEALKAAGVTHVINLRPATEDAGFDQAALMQKLGLDYMVIPVAGADDLNADTARALDAAEETRGQSRSITDKERHGFVPTPDDPAWKPLLNVIRPEPAPAALNMYGQRRVAMVSMLNTCDRVLAVSRFVREKFVSMGVDDERAEVLTIGSRMNAIVEANRELCFAPEPFSENPTRPIRLIFLGYNNHYKGLHVLADALELMARALQTLH